jgi:hypothetical protein
MAKNKGGEKGVEKAQDVFSSPRYTKLRENIRATGPVVELELTAPKLKGAFEASYDIVEARAFYIQTYVRTVYPEKAEAPIKEINRVLDDIKEALQVFSNQAAETLKECGVKEYKKMNPKTYSVVVTSPASYKYIKLYEIVDEYIGMLDVLWVLERVSPAERDKGVATVLKLLTGARQKVEEIFSSLTKEIAAAKTSKSANEENEKENEKEPESAE